LRKLIVLNLEKTSITDAGLIYLKGMINLSELYLNETKITDVGLERLKGFTQLSVLQLDDTYISKNGLDGLEKALPNCNIATFDNKVEDE
jgi:hypothetical protein